LLEAGLPEPAVQASSQKSFKLADVFTVEVHQITPVRRIDPGGSRPLYKRATDERAQTPVGVIRAAAFHNPVRFSPPIGLRRGTWASRC
jgi:hypothetical protein